MKPVSARDDGAGRAPRVRPRPWLELLVIATIFGLYKVGRAIAAEHVSSAYGHAHDIWSFERWLHLPSEAHVQSWLLSSAQLSRAANIYYAYGHWVATSLFLLWVYLAWPQRYRRIRRTFGLVTAMALVLHFAYPLAPPRLLPGIGMIDLAAKYGPAVYSSDTPQTAANQFAAMPSLHAGWSVLVAIELIVASSAWWRWVWAGHPIATILVIVGTANHYWMDVVVVLVLLAASMWLAWWWTAHDPRATAGSGDTRRRGGAHPVQERHQFVDVGTAEQ